MKTLEYNSKRLAKRIQALMKESSNVIVSPNTSKNVPKMQEIDEQEAYKQERSEEHTSELQSPS